MSSLRKVGYHKPTLLQHRVVPLIMKGKDLAVEAVGGSGKTFAFILPLVLRLRRGKAGIRAIVLTKDLETSRKITFEFRKFSKLGKGSFSVYALGTDCPSNPGSAEYGRPTSSRKERNILAGGPDVLVGTPDRVIDHIRRGNLHFKFLQTVIIDEPEQQADFAHDVLFIYSKFPPRKQTILFSPSFQDKTDPLLALLRRPILLNGSVWKAPRIKESFVPVGTELQERLELLPQLLLAHNIDSVLILCQRDNTVRQAVRVLNKTGFKANLLLETLNPESQKKICKSFSVGKSAVLVSTFDAAYHNKLRWVTHIINVEIPPEGEHYQQQSFVLEKVITLGTMNQYTQIQEKKIVQLDKVPSTEEVIRGSIEQMLKTIKQEENPVELNRLRRQIRRHVPISLRSYFMTYLFKITLSRGVSPGVSRGVSRGASPSVSPGASPGVENKKEVTRLFISVGKNRGVYANDLKALFVKSLPMDQAGIGEA